MTERRGSVRIAAVVLAALVLAVAALAQPGAPPAAGVGAAPAAQAGRGAGRGPQGPAVVSPEVLADRRIAFRILAPQAQNVRLNASDIPNLGQGAQLKKGDNGVWESNVGPIDPGAYRYTFNVDGVATIDPRNPSISESNTNVWSLVYVPGSDFMDTKDVPRGAVAAITYYSTALKKFRRMHVYTPPGYDLGKGKYPIFYLLHGAGDCDEAWTSVGRAGFILDNLIAAKKVKPMVVVMPAGHTSAAAFGGGRGAAPAAGGAPAQPPVLDEFAQDFLTDIMPYAETHYRILTDRADRAIAGLSMGGQQTMNIAFLHLDKFAYIGVFSSGATLGGGGRGRGAAPGAPAAPPAAAAPAAPAGPSPFETSHMADLDNAALKKGTRLIWLSTGHDDGLMTSTLATVEMLKKHGFSPVFKESPGAHTWINWRNYLNEFAPQLFQ
jgi:enterochelin esterase family protein